MAGTAEARLRALGLTLPGAASPVANYVPTHAHDGLLLVSGQVSRHADGRVAAGKLGAGTTLEEGQAAARLCALALLAQAKAALGDLDRIGQVLKLTAFVNATPDFADHPKVVNGCSDLLVEVLGDRGRHTRSAVGVASLPAGAAVEIEAIMAIGK
jgi:enamine deaminase RidA (YjgF/YER057c/UK114 family)